MTASPEGAGVQEQQALAALAAFREALRAGDSDRVEALLFPEPVEGSETDLFRALRAEAGSDAAVNHLCRFWSAAETTRYRVRPVSASEVEVYEHLSAPNFDVPRRTVTLLRHSPALGWQVVVTTDAADDRPRMCVYRAATDPPLDDVAFSRRCQQEGGPGAELFMDGQDGVLGHPRQSWVGALRGPLRSDVQRSFFAAASEYYELSLEPGEDVAERIPQLSWLARVAVAAADATGSAHVGVPGAQRILPRETLRHLARDQVADASAADATLPLSRLLTMWVKVHRQPALAGEGFSVTRGLLHFGLPELEVRLEDCADPEQLDRLTTGTVSAMVAGLLPTEVGTTFHLRGTGCRLAEGRRGVQPGHSYGPFGARRVELLPPP